MNAMGIIGIILSGGVVAVLLMGGIYALYTEWYDHKQKMLSSIIDHACHVYGEETRDLIRNIMEDSIEFVPNMTKACIKSFGEDEES